MCSGGLGETGGETVVGGGCAGVLVFGEGQGRLDKVILRVCLKSNAVTRPKGVTLI